jgi:hypothetical protein
VTTPDSEYRENQVATIRNLIPSQYIQNGLVAHISFNPIAPGILAKALVKISSHFQGGRGISVADCETIAQSSGGLCPSD